MASTQHHLSAQDLGLAHFTPTEFRGWWGWIDPRWLVCVDLLRESAGLIIDLSPVEGAIGRRRGAVSASDHNVDKWGRVYGVDVLPRWTDPAHGYPSIEKQAMTFFRSAIDCGFTAIGYYPDWFNAKGTHSPGFHLGTRRNRKPGDPATWGGLRDQAKGYQYVSAVAALKLTEPRIV